MKKTRTTLIGLLLLLLLAVGAPFFIPGPNGKPLMSFDRVKRIMSEQFPVARHVDRLNTKAKVKADEISQKLKPSKKPAKKPVKKPENVEVPAEPPPETLYKWRDRNGTWHFTNRPPEQGVEYSIVKWEGVERPAAD
jgi:hypothetical protein